MWHKEPAQCPMQVVLFILQCLLQCSMDIKEASIVAWVNNEPPQTRMHPMMSSVFRDRSDDGASPLFAFFQCVSCLLAGPSVVLTAVWAAAAAGWGNTSLTYSGCLWPLLPHSRLKASKLTGVGWSDAGFSFDHLLPYFVISIKQRLSRH